MTRPYRKNGTILDFFSPKKRVFFSDGGLFPEKWAIFRKSGQKGFCNVIKSFTFISLEAVLPTFPENYPLFGKRNIIQRYIQNTTRLIVPTNSETGRSYNSPKQFIQGGLFNCSHPKILGGNS